MPIDVEVMIVSYGSAADVERCLESVATSMPGARIAMREHHPDPDRFAELRRVAERTGAATRVSHDPANPGFAAGCNALARDSTADWFLFLNPDTRLVAWPWDTSDPPAPGIYGPEFTADTTDHRGRSFRIRDEIARSWVRRPGPAPDGSGFVSGAALLIDAASFHRIGGFDERYFLFYEDIDLCLRANTAGAPTHVEPEWRVEHARGHSTRERFGQALVWSYESACRFHADHSGPVAGYRLYVMTDSLLRAAVHAVRRDPVRRRAYLGLAARAGADALRAVRPRRRARSERGGSLAAVVSTETPPSTLGSVDGHDPSAGEIDATLSELDDAVNYARWIVDLVGPHLAGPILELGSGHGTYTEAFAEIGQVHAVEPGATAYARLAERFAGDPRVDTEQALVHELDPDARYGSAVMLNVLEHIDDDAGALRDVYDRLVPGGHLALWVPAFELLFSRFDVALGHHRRYRRAPLVAEVEDAGFEVVEARYMNLPGWFSWLLVARLLRRTPSHGPLLRIFDSVIVPVTRFVEDRVRAPFGQSILLIARRPR